MTTLQHNRPREQCTRLPVAFGAVALVLTLAAEGAAETPEERRTDLLKGAAAALRNGRTAEAIAKWRGAWDIRPAPEIACDIGTGEFLYGSLRAAAEFLSICEREYPASPRDKDRMAEYRRKLARAREQIGVFEIKVEQEGATVLIDGRNVGRTPLNRVFVDPGAHRIEVTLDGYMRHELVTKINKGEERTISIKLAKRMPGTKAAPVHPKPDPMPEKKSDGPKLSIAIAGGAFAIVGAGIGAAFTVTSNNAVADRHSTCLLCRGARSAERLLCRAPAPPGAGPISSSFCNIGDRSCPNRPSYQAGGFCPAHP